MRGVSIFPKNREMGVGGIDTMGTETFQNYFVLNSVVVVLDLCLQSQCVFHTYPVYNFEIFSLGSWILSKVLSLGHLINGNGC